MKHRVFYIVSKTTNCVVLTIHQAIVHKSFTKIVVVVSAWHRKGEEDVYQCEEVFQPDMLTAMNFIEEYTAEQAQEFANNFKL